MRHSLPATEQDHFDLTKSASVSSKRLSRRWDWLHRTLSEPHLYTTTLHYSSESDTDREGTDDPNAAHMGPLSNEERAECFWSEIHSLSATDRGESSNSTAGSSLESQRLLPTLTVDSRHGVNPTHPPRDAHHQRASSMPLIILSISSTSSCASEDAPQATHFTQKHTFFLGSAECPIPVDTATTSAALKRTCSSTERLERWIKRVRLRRHRTEELPRD
ncbi:hypothetical protein BZG36_04371 [Bifiguratus adelaidae]|uniref:Uncharacterized protein n=1 Tax=Bifiguratus adelaidae TaxID=1938954 RepID=A0A261XVV7_9FUNG|nr:hypothetical protein BZG36_04371 [Bifiguratus adelaidae]